MGLLRKEAPETQVSKKYVPFGFVCLQNVAYSRFQAMMGSCGLLG